MGLLQALLFLVLTGIAGCYEDLDAFQTTPNENYYVTPGGEGPELACSLKPEYADQKHYKVLWSRYYKENVRIVFDENGIRDKAHYALKGDVNKGIYNLLISNVTRGSVEGEYQCTVLSKDSDEQFMTKRAKVVILLPPGEPKIVDFPEESLVEGELLVVKCASEGGSPSPVFTWQFPNGSLADQRLYRTATVATAGEEVTESTFSFRVRADDNDAFVTCSVRNLAMENRVPLEVKSPRLNVLFKPYVRVHPADELTVEDGQSIELSCDSHANPSPPSYEWIHLNTGERYIAPKWALVADRKLAGRFECRGKNSVGEGSAELNLIVQYGPVVTTKKYLNPSEKERVEVECLVDANPKPNEVRWMGPDGFVVNGPRLVLPSISRDQTGNYTCEAVNYLTIYDQPGSQERKGRASLLIDVKRKPGKAEPSAANRQVIAGDNIELTCSTNDPGSPHAQYKWASPSSGNAFGGEGHSEQVLRIENAQLSDNGIYRCKAWNPLGEGEEGSIRITVIEPARISRPLTKDYLFSRGDQKKLLECEAQGYPAPSILWYKDGKLLNEQKRYKTELSEIKTSCSDGENCVKAVTGSLVFADAIRWSDKGNYSCAATNNADFSVEDDERISWGVVRVSHSPVILNEKYPTESLAASDLGHTAEISCIVSARPPPTFTWFFNSEPIEEGDRRTFEMREMEGRMDEYEQVLRVADVKKADYGKYLCRATNGAGDKAEVVIELKPTDVPQIPDDLQKLSSTSDSLLLGWRPRFNGGYAQTFEIEHRMLDPFAGAISKSNPVSIMISNATRIEDVKIDGTADWLVLYNITGLRSLSTYYIRARSSNVKGTSKYGTMLVATTSDVEEDKTLQAPSTLSYDSLKGELLVSPPPPLDSCVLVYVSTEEVWRAANCYPSTQPIVDLFGGAFYKVRFCQRQTPYKCSQLSPVLEAGSLLGSRRLAFFIPIAIICFIAILCLVFLMICCRSRHTQKKIVALATTTFTALPNSDNKKATVHGSHTDSSIFTMDSSTNKLNTSGQPPAANSPDMANGNGNVETWHQVEQHFDTSRNAYLNETAAHPNGTLRRGEIDDARSEDGGSLGRVMREVIV